MLRQLERDVVTLFKCSGERIEKIKENVQSKIIFISDASLPIEEGDYVIRELPNKLIEEYLVMDRGFRNKFGSIAAHYQVSVKKETGIGD